MLYPDMLVKKLNLCLIDSCLLCKVKGKCAPGCPLCLRALSRLHDAPASDGAVRIGKRLRFSCLYVLIQDGILGTIGTEQVEPWQQDQLCCKPR